MQLSKRALKTIIISLAIIVLCMSASALKQSIYIDELNIKLEKTQKKLNETEELKTKYLNESISLKAKNKWTSLGIFKITTYKDNEDKYGSMTATGVRARANHTIAVDPKVIPYGSKIKIGNIIYTAEDCGGAVKGKVIDVFINRNEKQYMKHEEVFIKK